MLYGCIVRIRIHLKYEVNVYVDMLRLPVVLLVCYQQTSRLLSYVYMTS